MHIEYSSSFICILFCLISYKVVVGPMCKFSLVCRVMHFLMVSNQREHFSYSLFYFGCKYKEVKPLKFSNPHIWRAFWVPLLAFLSQLLSTLIFSALCDKRVFHTIFFYKSLSLSPQKMGTTSRTQRFIQWHKQTWKEI